MTLVIINIINHACVTGGAPPRVKASDCLPSLKGDSRAFYPMVAILRVMPP